MSSIGIALGLDAQLEGKILAELEQKTLPIKVVRRVLEISEALGAAQAGLISILVLDAVNFEIDRQVLTDLNRFSAELILICELDQIEEYKSFGVRNIISHFDPRVDTSRDIAKEIIDAVLSLIEPPAPKKIEKPKPLETKKPKGHVVAVWGTAGSPGRSTVAVNLAASLRSYGQTLLIDADVIAPCLQQMLAIRPEVSPLLSASRLAGQNRLDQDSFKELLTPVGDSVDLLGGLNQPTRWREVIPETMQIVLDMARENWPWTVVDLGCVLAASDTGLTTSRTLGDSHRAILEQADLTLILGLADPVGIRRLILLLSSLSQGPSISKKMVVINRVRESVAGKNPIRSVKQLAEIEFRDLPTAILREDQNTIDDALIQATDIFTINDQSLLAQDLWGLTQQIRSQMGYTPQRRRGRKNVKK